MSVQLVVFVRQYVFVCSRDVSIANVKAILSCSFAFNSFSGSAVNVQFVIAYSLCICVTAQAAEYIAVDMTKGEDELDSG